ncbi:cobalamin-dependent protein [Streptomyces sp. Tu 3180]|uniref:cobalamin B12-binding domain-containing protein n=1 Tax=Streptomyces sp. Tu 3180 TaxID=2682611 RepID=UPI00135A3A59|nr:cobalamin-dependent protein [Streptomyces sp. Tu 3180]KAF3463502.1 methylaspartate mutase [Streptomyces sp. Tu 3180]
MADLSRPAGTAPGRARATVVVTTVASDSHTWNLVFLQLLLEELGYHVVNLGPCVPDELLVRHCREIRPAAVIISSVNGHGAQDGLRVIRALRDDELTAALPVAIGGKLGVDGGATSHAERLLAAGFDAVFEDGTDTLAAFRRFLDDLGTGPDRALGARPRRAGAGQARRADEQMGVPA